MASGELHKFLDAVRKAETWAMDAHSRLTAHEALRSVADADALIARHVEKLAEVDGRQVSIIFSFLLSLLFTLSWFRKHQNALLHFCYTLHIFRRTRRGTLEN